MQAATQLHRLSNESEFRGHVSALLAETGGHTTYACATLDEAVASLLLFAARRLRMHTGMLDHAQAMLDHVAQLGGGNITHDTGFVVSYSSDRARVVATALHEEQLQLWMARGTGPGVRGAIVRQLQSPGFVLSAHALVAVLAWMLNEGEFALLVDMARRVCFSDARRD